MIKMKPCTDTALASTDDPSEAIVDRRKRRIARQALFDNLADSLRSEVAQHQAKLSSLMLISDTSHRQRDLVAALLDADPSSNAPLLLLIGRPQILSHHVAGTGPVLPPPRALQPAIRPNLHSYGAAS